MIQMNENEEIEMRNILHELDRRLETIETNQILLSNSLTNKEKG